MDYSKALIDAISCDDVTRVREILQVFEIGDEHERMYSTLPYNDSYLRYACRHSSLEMVKCVFDNSSYVVDDHTLVIAAERDRTDIAEYLIDIGADVNGEGDYNIDNPLTVAGQHGHERMVKFLIEKGADVSQYDGPRGSSQTITQYRRLFDAVAEGDVKTVAAILEDDSMIVDISYLERMQIITLLQSACKNGSIETVRCLVEHGADVNKPYNTFARLYGRNNLHTPLGIASMTGNVELAKYLLDNGAFIDGNSRCNPLHTAVQWCNLEIVKLLVDNGADMTRRLRGMSLFSYNPDNPDNPNYRKCLYYLLAHGAVIPEDALKEYMYMPSVCTKFDFLARRGVDIVAFLRFVRNDLIREQGGDNCLKIRAVRYTFKKMFNIFKRFKKRRVMIVRETTPLPSVLVDLIVKKL